MTETRYRAPNIEQEMEKNHRRYRQRVEDIRADEDLNEQARRRYLDEAYREARATHSSLFDQRRAELLARVERYRKEALAPPRRHGADPETLQISYRDALDRVADITDRDKLTGLLERAELTGDAVLGKAVLQRGYELEDDHVVGAYLQKYPQDRERWDRFMAAAVEHNELQEQGQMFGDMGPQKPRELGGVG